MLSGRGNLFGRQEAMALRAILREPRAISDGKTPLALISWAYCSKMTDALGAVT
jgi:hypothetical protein